jgi:hypothetical protein
MRDTASDLGTDGSEGERAAGEPKEPKQLITQGAVKRHPQRWTTTEEADRWLAWTPAALEPRTEKLAPLVGLADADKRVEQLAKAEADGESIAGRRRRLAGHLPLVQFLADSVKRELSRVRRTLDKTPRLERYAIGRTELALGERFSLARMGDAANALFWVLLFLCGCAAEVVVGNFNITRADLDEMTDEMAWVMALLPFLSTFAALKWLDPGDIDRDRHSYYAWLTRLAVVVTPCSLLLFAAKLDALLEVDYSNPEASLGPSYTSVLWMMQVSFAISVYLASLKIGDAWFRFLGYDVRKTREYLDLCDDIAVCEDALRSLVEIGDRIRGAIEDIEARASLAVQKFNLCYQRCVRDDEQRRRRANDRAAAAAAQARLDADD